MKWTDDPRFKSFLVYFFSFLAVGTAIAAPGPALIRLQENTGGSVAAMSSVLTCRAAANLFAAAFGGPLFDRYDGNKINMVCMFLAGASCFIMPFCTSVWTLGAIMTFQGASMGALDTGGNVLLIWLYKDEVGPYMQALHFGFGIGAFISPVIVAALIQATDTLVWPFFMIGVLLVVMSVCLALLDKAPTGKEAHAGGTSEEEEGATVGAARNMTKYYVTVICTAFALGCYVGVEVNGGFFFPAYSVDLNMLKEVGAAYLVSVYWGALAFGRGLAVFISHYLRPQTMLVLDYVGCTFGLILIIAQSTDITTLYVGMSIFGMSMGSIFPTCLSLADVYIDVKGSTAGYFVIGSSVGEMVIPIFTGLAYENEGPKSLPVYCLSFILASFVAVLILIVFFNPKKSTLPKTSSKAAENVEMHESNKNNDKDYAIETQDVTVHV